MREWLLWIGARVEFWHLVVAWVLLTLVPFGMMLADRYAHTKAIRRRLDDINRRS